MISKLSHQTLPALLAARASAQDSATQVIFLDTNGNVDKSFSYRQLYHDSSACAHRLLAAGLKPSDVVLTIFPDHESHIRLFWACCLAGIPICPLPTLHPDKSRQALLLNHLKVLFNNPTLIGTVETLGIVRSLVPDFLVLDLDDLPNVFDEGAVYPSRQPSSSDAVCFMLTSGSTGNSKAVTLTHLNLLSSVRGKIRHHRSTAASRFFNWVAFDHVACLSEVHIHALEANASQWHVAPIAIIRNPRNLLEWSSALAITYTFSPNFLLAQIIRDVSISPFESCLDLSSLRAFISGGESVPTRTGIALADILEEFGAFRDVLRAGFGMSETAAGCIYDTRRIPRLEDITPDSPKYLSLGTPCWNLEARVVDACGVVCPPGIAGYLQVRGAAVFSGYFGNDSATKESFTNDGWFVTGDTAEIDLAGNISVIGREKDCLNINGVKYLTHDVEHYIEDAKIEGVMHSYVYVCPLRLENADTETYGVFYQHQLHVEEDLDAAQVHLLKAVNRSIKNACTVFCSQSPHVVLPLPRISFIKTSLGKVSRTQLATSYLQKQFDTIQLTLDRQDSDLLYHKKSDLLSSPIEKTIAGEIQSVFSIDASTLRRSHNLFDFGASSMHLMRLKQLFQDRLSLPELPTIDLLKRPEIGELCDYLADIKSDNVSEIVPPVYEPLVCMRHSGSRPPLFLVHPGVGEVLVFLKLAIVLDDDRPVYGIRARGFDVGESMFDTLAEMVEVYTASVEDAFPSGPYYITGYSYGAAIAFEIGKALEAKGRQVDFLGIMNLPPHIQFRMKELIWSEVLLNIGMFLSLFPSSSLPSIRKQLGETFPLILAEDTVPSNPQEVIQWMFDRVDKGRLVELDLEIVAFVRWVQVAYDINRTGRSFVPSGMVKDALTTVFCAIPLPSMGTREEFKEKRLSVWKEFSGEMFEMVDVDGEHYTMLSDDHVLSFAGHMRAALARATSLSTSRRPSEGL